MLIYKQTEYYTTRQGIKVERENNKRESHPRWKLDVIIQEGQK